MSVCVWRSLVLALVAASLAASSLPDAEVDGVEIETIAQEYRTAVADFVPLSMIELEEHEDTETPPFSVCRYLLDESAKRVTAADDWPQIAQHIASVRAALPSHVRSACDHFIKHNKDDIVSFLQLGGVEDEIERIRHEEEAREEQEEAKNKETSSSDGDSTAARIAEESTKFWEERGQYCGACLTLTKKIQKWMSLNCTQRVVSERVMRMCGTMPPGLKTQCLNNRVWIEDFVIKQLFNKFPLPNHCAYIGLCEKNMVITALQNPLVMADKQNALLEQAEGGSNLVQESELVLQTPRDTVNTAPEITFDLSGGQGVTYRDVDISSGNDLPKIYVDGTQEGTSLLETESTQFDGNDQDPHFRVHAQGANDINVPIMHADLVENKPFSRVQKTYGFQENHLPIASQYLKGCSACQFTLSALFEFLNNPRTIRTLLPAVKNACKACNSPEEVVKCQELVEKHGVAFYRDVVRQASPKKWCPRLELCEIQYFIPSPHVLSDTYSGIKDSVTKVD